MPDLRQQNTFRSTCPAAPRRAVTATRFGLQTLRDPALPSSAAPNNLGRNDFACPMLTNRVPGRRHIFTVVPSFTS